MDLKIKQNIKLYLSVTFLFVLFLFSAITFVITFGQGEQNVLNYNNDRLSGVVENVVHVNDLDADYYYYKGLNFTYSGDGTLPTLDNKEIYSDSQLVEVEITYSGRDINTGEIGYVSLSELQDTYIYYRIMPVKIGPNGTYIEMELIENPFTNRPTNMGFNGWVTNYPGAQMSFDKDYYIRTVRVPVTYTGLMADKIEIDFNASWVNAAVSEMSSGMSWEAAFSELENDGMKEVPIVLGEERLPFDMTGYFKEVTVGYNQSYTGYYDSSGNEVEEQEECVEWFVPVGAEAYDENGVLQVLENASDTICYEAGHIIFKNSQSYSNVSTSGGSFEVLVVAGGGGGGSSGAFGTAGSGGGGAGGLIHIDNYFIPAGSLNITVGSGGTGAIYNGTHRFGNNGQNSSFGNLTAIGGGGGAGGNAQGNPGGSGGGSRGTSGGPSNQPTSNDGYPNSGFGNRGGNHSSSPAGAAATGGGGAGSPGQDIPGSGGQDGGAGGAGLEFDITGTPTYYAGGGGAGVSAAVSATGGPGGIGGGGAGANSNGGAQSGTSNTGGGGGGGTNAHSGADGGSGIVVVRWDEVIDPNICLDESGCIFYELIHDDFYDDDETYFELVESNMQVVNPNNLPFEYQYIYIEGYSDDSVMAGFFRSVNIPRFSSIEGYYDNEGFVQSGTCGTIGGCNLYEYIQYYDNSDNPELVDPNETYYHLVTRDTNIIVMTGNRSNAWTASENKPFTLTGVHNATNYDPIWTTNIVVRAFNDTNIENLRARTNQSQNNSDPPTGTGTIRTFYGNWQNVRIGRGVHSGNNNATFQTVLGGNNDATGSAGNVTKYRLIIESGSYSTFSIGNGGGTHTNHLEAKAIYGSDYDRVTNNNDNLDLNYCASGSWGGHVHASSNIGLIFDLVVKSGRFGSSYHDYTTGIYVGGRRGGSHNAARRVKVQGGWIYNLIGGPLTASDRGGLNDSYINVVGGEIDAITGGAGRSATYGNRIIQVTGGQINYAIFGGSNGVEGSGSDGTVIGDSFVYLGGNAVIGDPSLVSSNSTLYGAEAGSVFGIGNGREGFSAIGSSVNSNIIIDRNAIINRNVYGGGNFGATGIASASSTTESNIRVLNGTIAGDIYGGGNNNGAGSSSVDATINIGLYGGNIQGTVYGGSNVMGTIFGEVNINAVDGTVAGSVYGGGRGGYVNSSNQGTYVRNSININIGEGSSGPTINNNVYGGSAFGTVNSISSSPSLSSDSININVNNGDINGSLFGGAEGNINFSPYVAGDIVINVNGGEIDSVYGTNDMAGNVLGRPTINLNGGNITNVFGGGNQVGSNVTNIYLSGSTVDNIHGGSNLSGDVTESNIYLVSGSSNNVYGGNNVGGKTDVSNIELEGASVSSLFGGGNQADIDESNISLLSGTATNVFGGGAEANVLGSSNIELFGATVTNIYGGSNLSGNVPESNIRLIEGNAENVYGGNNVGGKTDVTNIFASVEAMEPSLPSDSNIEYIYDPSAPDLSNNATPCLVEGMEFTHILDKRNDSIYPVTLMGNQCVMASNLNYTGNGCLSNNWTSGAPFNACRSQSTSVGTEVLYQWDAAMNGTTNQNSQGLCPVDWFIPSDSEFQELESFIGMSPANINSTGWRGSSEGNILKDNINWNGLNTYGYSALPVGYFGSTGSYTGGGAFSIFWSSNVSGNSAFARYLHTNSGGINRSTLTRAFGFSVRCMMGDFTGEIIIPEPGEGATITNIYGGGKEAPVDITNIVLNEGEFTNVYGGGAEADVLVSTNITVNDVTINTIYGGSNLSGEVLESNVQLVSGEVANVYGGNNIGGKTSTTNVNLTGTDVTNIYGGGRFAPVDITNVNINNNNLSTVFGGGAEADVLVSTNVAINNATIETLYGGSNLSGEVEETNVVVNSGVIETLYGGNNYGGISKNNNINLLSGTFNNVYGGGNNANSENTNVNISLTSGSITNVYGGGAEADAINTNIEITRGNIETVYGGSNQAGDIGTSNIIVNGEFVSIGTVYGGNNYGGTTNNTNIDVIEGSIGNVFGGGNEAVVTNNTFVTLGDIDVLDTIYGGGNEAMVHGSTNVTLVGTSVTNSVYAGGNGVTAIVQGDTNLNVTGNSNIGEHVFGGGNAAATGMQSSNNSESKVNISGATILGNVYGGANTSVLYGTAEVNIGFGIFDEPLEESNILIEGTVFGGGEANAEGSEEYDFSFISVTNGITINIDGSGSNDLTILGSLFGSGNASSTTGTSEMFISNYGSQGSNQRNISIQRADNVVLDNSYIELFGATDRTNEFSTTLFSISRVRNLKLKNNSILYLETGANLLENLHSLVDIDGDEVKAEVIIDENGEVTRNVDNRIYLLSGRNLNIATNQAVTAYGRVHGMTFFGMYTRDFEGNLNEAFYSPSYENGDIVGIGEFYHFSDGSYILGRHATNHNTHVDGFYSSFESEEEERRLEMRYIQPTPEDSTYYMWVIGEAVASYDISLSASKFSTLGTEELSLLNFSSPNTRFSVLGVNYDYLDPEIDLVRQSEIPRISQDGTADTRMSLVMKTSNTGWLSVSETNFITDFDAPIYGSNEYISENSSVVPSLLFYLYHSKNLENDGDMGMVTISLLAVTPIDELTNEVERININVDLSRILYTTNDYEAAMTPGEENDVFVTTLTDITTRSKFSAYYSLFAESEEPFYNAGDYRSLVSSYVLPENTKFTMIDLTSETPEYYYYVVSEEDVTYAQNEFSIHGEASYPLSRFIAMGSTSSNNRFDDELKNSLYYNEELELVFEEFVFIADFSSAQIETSVLNAQLLLELRNSDSQTLINVLGVQHENMVYNLHANSEAKIEVGVSTSKSEIYLGETTNLDVLTNFVQQRYESRTVHDTYFYDQRLGLKLSVLDSNGNIVNGASLMGVDFRFDGQTHYPRMDGTVRINISQRVANASSRIYIDTTNSDLASDEYTIKVESFGSPDGIYFGLESSDQKETNLNILNNIFGLKTTIPDEQVIINKETGITSQGNNRINVSTQFSSGLSQPALRVSMKRREYDTIFSTNFELVDIKDYISNNLVEMDSEKNEYLIRTFPLAEQTFTFHLKDSLRSGTYKIIFSVYDGNNYIGEVYNYVIIK